MCEPVLKSPKITLGELSFNKVSWICVIWEFLIFIIFLESCSCKVPPEVRCVFIKWIFPKFFTKISQLKKPLLTN